jgi:glycyl-tRNA synthetase
MEMEFFCHPDESQKWYEYWVSERFDWFKSLGIAPERLRLRPHHQRELAHYARSCTDVEYEMPFGWSEMEGIADRSTYDLSQHNKESGKDLSYFDDSRKEKYVPAVIETSIGVERTCLAVLADAYREEEVRGEKRVVMGFDPSVAPIQVAVFPLSAKLSEQAYRIHQELKGHFASDFDTIGSIGKRYRRHDEIGTPFCITYDFQSEEDHAVTVRHRDSMEQDRISIDNVKRYLDDKFQFRSR